MAKLTGQIKIKGTIGDLVFIEDASKEIYVREKGKPGITKKQFKENPIFGRIWEHGTEFGCCVRKSRIFRLLAKQFYDKAKEVLNKKLEIKSEGLAFIPTEYKTEILCWEFKGNVAGTDFLVYINAETGKEEDILTIVNTPNGTLTM